MAPEKTALIRALNASVRDLQEGIDKHCCLVASIMKSQVDPRTMQPLLDLCPSNSRESVLKDAIKDAIEALEASRKAFKSKQLEALRKKLTQVLIDTH